jgi:hypothetical protein
MKTTFAIAFTSAFAFLAASCGGGQSAFHCSSNTNCDLMTGGVCETSGFCAYPATTCVSGLRYDANAGSMANMCVPLDALTACTMLYDGFEQAASTCTGALPGNLAPPSDIAFECQQMAAVAAAGHLTIDANAFMQCQNDFKNNPCDIGSALVDCLAAFKGTIAAGQSCHSAVECQSLSCDTSSCPGTCSPNTAGGIGQACTNGCQLALVCIGTPGTCQKMVGVGQACPMGFECQQGLYCDSTSHMCVTDVAAGGSCAMGQTCALTTQCQSGICTAYRKVGESCSSTQPCVSGANCVSGLCAAPPTLGQACGAMPSCGGGTVNVSCFDSYCNAPVDATTGSWSTTGTCVARIPIGNACNSQAPDSFTQCVPGGRCTANVCQSYACYNF